MLIFLTYQHSHLLTYSSIFKPRGAKVRNLVLQISSLLSGSNGSVTSVKVISTLSKDHHDLHLKNDYVNYAYDTLLFLLYVGNSYSCSIST